MPLYEFVCSKCGLKTEVIQPFDREAPECCDNKMERKIGNLASWSWGTPLTIPYSPQPTNTKQLAKAATRGWEKVHK